MPEQVICILGMHRSGTSCLTGSLQAHGLSLGQHSTWNPHNLQGNRENDAVVALHEGILEDNGGSWDNPPTRLCWSTRHRQAARDILASHEGESVWGFKDPRSLLLLAGWRELLGNRLHCVGIFRHPHSVAASLGERGQVPRRQALHLWLTYNRRLMQEYRHSRIPLLSFDWSPQDFEDRVAAVAAALALGPRQQASFYNADLHNHHHQSLRGLPPSCALLYWRLRRLANHQLTGDRLGSH